MGCIPDPYTVDGEDALEFYDNKALMGNDLEEQAELSNSVDAPNQHQDGEEEAKRGDQVPDSSDVNMIEEQPPNKNQEDED